MREEGRRGGREREREREKKRHKKKRFVVLYIYKLPINRQRGQMLHIFSYSISYVYIMYLMS